jgi:AcrR family transcriptional regulator
MTPKKAAERTDRRVARTHRALREALIALVQERGWDEVTVQDVCARADVGRSTFYLHFADKEELLVSGFDGLRRELRERAKARDVPMGFALALLEHTTEYEGLHRVLGARTALVVQREFMNVVIELIDEDLARELPAGPLREAGARYLAGAFYELLRWWGGWGEKKRRAPAVEVDDVFRRLTTPVLRELRRAAGEAKKG